MNWEAISAIGQLVGAHAVVISLIYLAREVRSNARATRHAAMRSTLDNFNRLAQQLTEHSDLAELYYRGVDDFESLEGVDRARFSWFMHQMFRNMEDVYHQHLKGHLDPHLWRGLERGIASLGVPFCRCYFVARFERRVPLHTPRMAAMGHITTAAKATEGVVESTLSTGRVGG